MKKVIIGVVSSIAISFSLLFVVSETVLKSSLLTGMSTLELNSSQIATDELIKLDEY